MSISWALNQHQGLGSAKSSTNLLLVANFIFFVTQEKIYRAALDFGYWVETAQ